MNSRSSISQFEVIRQLRFPMIVLVTFAHSYGRVEEGYSLLTSDWNTYEFLKLLVSQTLVKVAVPVFFIMSGYLFFANVERWNVQTYKQKMLRRVKTLLIPYLFWNLLMGVKLHEYNLSIFWTPANMPLWFLRDLIVVSMLTPIIYIGVRRLGFRLFLVLLPVYLTGLWAIQPDLNPYGICFFTLGAFFSIRKMDLIVSALRYKWTAFALSALFGIAMLLSYQLPFSHDSIFSFFMLCFRLTGAVAVFCLSSHIFSHTSRRLPRVVCDSNYFIYLAHYVFFLSFIDTAFFALFGTSTMSLSLHYLLCPLMKASIFVCLYVVWRHLRMKINTPC